MATEEKAIAAGFQFPDTAAGRQAEWFFKWMQRSGQGLTPEEVSEHMYFTGNWKPEQSVERFKQAKEPQGGWKLSEAKSITPFHSEFVETDDSNRRWIVTFRVEESEPHRILDCRWDLDLGGATVRHATAEDSAELAQLERDTPMILGDTTVTYDRGEDFWSLTRLMEENVCFIAEQDGEILALHCAACHRIRIGGTEYRGMLGHHSRIPKRNQKRGFFSALNNQAFDHYSKKYGAWWQPPPDGYGAYAYTAVENTSALRLGGPGSWSIGPVRALIECASVASDEYGHLATEADAETVVSILNECHDQEEMYLPFTVDSLKARFERAPDVYSWSNVLLGEKAMLGIWASGLRVITETADGRHESVRASTLDHGFISGAEDEFEKLVRAYAGRLLNQGVTEFSIITSEGSPGFQTAKRLAYKMDAFAFRMTIPEPEGTKERGLYVDAIYF